MKYESPNVEKLIGWKAEELVSKSVFSRIHNDDLESAKVALTSLINKQSMQEISELRLVCKDGSHKWIK